MPVPTVTVDDLRVFHAKHFPHASTPDTFLHGVENDTVEEYHNEEDDGLGYYPDGTKRTLTDDQIAMFRHSEIYNILRKRRLRREVGELSEEGEAEPSPQGDVASSVSTPIEKPQSANRGTPKAQQWTTSSARTKARNKKHRNKYRAKLKHERTKRESRTVNDGDEESDEWDPWHQATGPDAQKDDAIDLDY
ncbi:hypothetical protein GQ44DRAFT_696697 [Phaeosphaeriaceae sp. PMI808]|nr:hypothetical protein GQ44DRAFT_696697 [Phaeosphaeriaceae sp. PMI808]